MEANGIADHLSDVSIFRVVKSNECACWNPFILGSNCCLVIIIIIVVVVNQLFLLIIGTVALLIIRSER
jgi:hypothetical protein